MTSYSVETQLHRLTDLCVFCTTYNQVVTFIILDLCSFYTYHMVSNSKGAISHKKPWPLELQSVFSHCLVVLTKQFPVIFLNISISRQVRMNLQIPFVTIRNIFKLFGGAPDHLTANFVASNPKGNVLYFR